MVMQPDTETNEEIVAAIEHQQQAAPAAVGRALLAARSNGDPIVRETVLRYLPECAAREPDWQSFIVSCLGARDPLLRGAAVAAVGRLREVKLSSHVRRMLSDRNKLVRVEALETLRDLGVVDACREIEDRLRNDSSGLVRGYAADTLAELCPQYPAGLLKERAACETIPWARAAILLALCRSGQAEYLPAVLRSLRSQNYRIRCLVANGLEPLTDAENRPRIRAALLDALDREDSGTAREALQQAVDRIG